MSLDPRIKERTGERWPTHRSKAKRRKNNKKRPHRKDTK